MKLFLGLYVEYLKLCNSCTKEVDIFRSEMLVSKLGIGVSCRDTSHLLCACGLVFTLIVFPHLKRIEKVVKSILNV